MDFRPAYQALADRLQHDLGSALKSAVSRQNLPASSFPDQPALVLVETGVDPQWQSERDDYPALFGLSALLVLHTKTSGDDPKPGDQVLELIAGVLSALRWRDTEPKSPFASRYWTTLDGAVLRARLEAVIIEDDVYDPAQVSTKMSVSMLVSGTE